MYNIKKNDSEPLPTDRDVKIKIECLVDIKMKLQYLVSQNLEDNGLHEIFEKVVQYIQSNCHHHVIEDYIDTDYENSTKIKYCETCLETFP